MKVIISLIFVFIAFIDYTLPMFSQQSFADLMLGNMYGKSKQEVYQYLKAFPLKNDNGELDYTILEPLLSETKKAHDTVLINSNIYLGDQWCNGMGIYFYMGKAYCVYTTDGGFSIGKELTTILGKGKAKKGKVSAYGGIDIVETTKWNTSDFKVVYAEGGAVPTFFEVIYTPISKSIQKPILKIYMEDGNENTKPYHVEWSSDSNNVTNHCSSINKLELVGNVQNLSFVVQCLNGNEVYRKNIAQSKGKKTIFTYKDLPEGCDPVYIGKEWGMDDNESVQSSRYLFKLFEGEYEHFSGSLYLDDCMD
jgi:hypothetical protein